MKIYYILKNYFLRSRRQSLAYKVVQNGYFEFQVMANLVANFLSGAKLQEVIRSVQFNRLPVKIQLGTGAGNFGVCAPQNIKTYINTDLFGKFVIDVRKPFKIPDSTVDLYFSSHLIEHLTEPQIEHLLMEQYRTIKYGGSVYTACPALDKVFHALYDPQPNKDRDLLLQLHGPSLLGMTPTPARIINAVTHICYGHRFMLDFETFVDLAQNAGFTNIRRIEIEQCEDAVLKSHLRGRSDVYWAETELWCMSKGDCKAVGGA